MRISIVVPSYRATPAAIGRLLEWSGYDPERFEVVVRDNSNDPRKREILERCAGPALRLTCVDPCDATTNFIEAMRLATGQMRMWCGDDDRLFPQGLEQMHRAVSAQSLADDSQSLLAFGGYFSEHCRSSSIVRYPPLVGETPLVRLQRFSALSGGTNFLFYSAMSRRLSDQVASFTASLPCHFSFTDQIMVLFYLLAGRVVQFDQVFYGYSNDEWDTAEKSLAKDRDFYAKAGFDIGIDILHHLLIGLEGFLLLRSKLAGSLTSDNLWDPASTWFMRRLAKFRAGNRSRGLSGKTAEQAMALRTCLIAERKLEALSILDAVAEVMSISNVDLATRYREYWRAL